MTTFTEYAKAAAERERQKQEAERISLIEAHTMRVVDAAHDWLWEMFSPFDGDTVIDFHQGPEALGQWDVVFDIGTGPTGAEQQFFMHVAVPHNGDKLMSDGQFVGHIVAWNSHTNTWITWTEELRKRLRFTDLASLGRAFEYVESKPHLMLERPAEEATA